MAARGEEAIFIKECAAQEAMQSSSIAVPQISSPRQEIPQSSNLALGSRTENDNYRKNECT
jgi:hypothetical protein